MVPNVVLAIVGSGIGIESGAAELREVTVTLIWIEEVGREGA